MLLIIDIIKNIFKPKPYNRYSGDLTLWAGLLVAIVVYLCNAVDKVLDFLED